MTRPDDYRQELMRKTRDISAHRARRYWAEVLTTALIIWSSVAAVGYVGPTLMLIVLLVGVLATYRGLLFSHELFHLGPHHIRGLRTAWHLLIGVPFLFPLFFLRCHGEHHSIRTYGTIRDPEYLPFGANPALRRAFVVGSMTFPFVLVVRALLLVPIALAHRPLRAWMDQRFSCVAMNGAYRPTTRLDVEGRLTEVATSLFSVAIAQGVVAGWASGAVPICLFGFLCGANCINMIRTLRAHHYEGFGHRTLRGQVQDTRVEEWPAPLAILIAPLGQRFHAVHHALPNLPFHSLREAHQRAAVYAEPEIPDAP